MNTGTNALGKYLSVPFWTEGALECYVRGCVCNEECGNFKVLGRRCNMKACVLESVKTLGNPKESEARKQRASRVG